MVQISDNILNGCTCVIFTNYEQLDDFIQHTKKEVVGMDACCRYKGLNSTTVYKIYVK